MSVHVSRAQVAGRSLAKLSRPQNVVVPGLLATLAAYCNNAPLHRSLTCYVLIYCLYVIAVSYNNLHDRKTDTLNKRTDTVLFTTIDARLLYALLIAAIIGAIGANRILRQPESFVITIIFVVLLVLYSHPLSRLQARGWFGPIILSCTYGLLPILLGLQQQPLTIHARTLGATLAITSLIFSTVLAKDYKDEYGDRGTGKRTPLVCYGAWTVRRVAMGVAIASASFLIILFAPTNAWPLVAPLAVSYCIFCDRLHAAHGKLPLVTTLGAKGVLLLLGAVIYIQLLH